ncbi:hypothetical protein AGMMS50276_14820 [Synergistales bacterium]|nr:hypothetical protein AGMMS50276_14820 [Synergistales bacterium]
MFGNFSNRDYAQIGFFWKRGSGITEVALINVDPGNAEYYDVTLKVKFDVAYGRKGSFNQKALAWLHQKELALLSSDGDLFLELSQWKSPEPEMCFHALPSYHIKSNYQGFVILHLCCEQVWRADFKWGNNISYVQQGF